MNDQPTGLSDAELAAETAQALPDKEVVSILDLNADLDLAIDAAAPIDLGVAALPTFIPDPTPPASIKSLDPDDHHHHVDRHV